MGSSAFVNVDISTHSLTRRLTFQGNRRSRHNRHFNSQPHEEADKNGRAISGAGDISTHSLTRRLTFNTVVGIRSKKVFQLTASRGG